MWTITKYYVGLLLPIFITSVFGIDKELGCPKKDYKLRDKAYMKLEGKSGEFCISCYYTKGGPDESKQECIQIPFNESEIDILENLRHRSNRGIIYHINGTFSTSHFFILACKNDVGPHIKESFYVENILNGTVCGNKKNQKIKILNIRNNTDVDQNDDDISNNTIAENNNTLPCNCTLDDDNDQTNFNSTLDDGIQSLLYLHPFGDDMFWFKFSMLMIAITSVLMIGNIAYCLKSQCKGDKEKNTNVEDPKFFDDDFKAELIATDTTDTLKKKNVDVL